MMTKLATYLELNPQDAVAQGVRILGRQPPDRPPST